MTTLLFIGFVAFLYWAYSQAGKPAKRRKRSVPKGEDKSPHEVLGVEAGASTAEIRKAYQEKVKQYHPDRVANAAPELQRLAELRTKELNAAYRALTGAK